MIAVEPTQLLLIEDDPNDAELIQMVLARDNFANHMVVKEDGEQAIRYLLRPNDNALNSPLPRLILLDLKLPKINGVEVLRQIRQHPRTRNLIVVIMTSSAEDRDLDTCYELGVNSYIVKPLEFQQFVKVIQKVGVYWMMLNTPPLLTT